MQNYTDVTLAEWDECGLPKAGLVRLAKVVTIDSKLVLKKLGSLKPKDQKQIRANLRRMLEGVI